MWLYTEESLNWCVYTSKWFQILVTVHWCGTELMCLYSHDIPNQFDYTLMWYQILVTIHLCGGSIQPRRCWHLSIPSIFSGHRYEGSVSERAAKIKSQVDRYVPVKLSADVKNYLPCPPHSLIKILLSTMEMRALFLFQTRSVFRKTPLNWYVVVQNVEYEYLYTQCIVTIILLHVPLISICISSSPHPSILKNIYNI